MAEIPTHVWVFRARLGTEGRVVDGDTADLELDVGMHARRLERLRFLGVNAPELHRTATHEAGLAAKVYVDDWLAEAHAAATDIDWPLILTTERDPDNFGRYLASIWRTSDGHNLNQDLLDAGQAVPYVPHG